MTALKNVLGSLLAAGVLVTSPSAFADAPGHDGRDGQGHDRDKGDKGDKGDKKAAAAPELAGKGAPAALALIAGGAAIVVSRRRRQS